MPVYFYDSGGLTIEKFCGIVKEAVRKNGVKMVFIDYIQLLMVQNAKDFGNREAQVNFISKRIKRLARELSIPIMALSQLSRLEKGTKRKYKLSDLRESGALEQDSDNVIFLYNPSYHGVEEMEFYDKNENGNYEKQTIAFDHEDCLILIEKCRLGETGIVRCKFKGQFSRHEDLPNSQRIQKTEDFSFNDRPF
jgi:replicative DNA helicase